MSHLLAISGFHLGVLSTVLFFLVRPMYRLFQKRYFPYAHANRDTFIFVACCLLLYMLFLGTPPSLLRAFGMLVVGFVLYDRGYE
ncbi:MAG: ComEC/Rec2 family competence protein, partial [Candidatus Cloacimonetes bacterium]|nr:ComEC/Rec2 family competence protein [Candidatus Cloacimonadota bacterium]